MAAAFNYHYLLAEVFRWVDVPYDEFWKMSKKEQADLIWRVLNKQEIYRDVEKLLSRNFWDFIEKKL